MASFAQRVAEPLETFVETVSGGSTGGLDVLETTSVTHLLTRNSDARAYPSALPQAVQTKLIGDLSRVHGIGQILLVREDEQQGVPQLVLIQHPLQLLTGLNDTVTIVAVDDEDDALGVLEVMPPQRSNLVLSTDIPHGELNVLVFDRLDVETWWASGLVPDVGMGFRSWAVRTDGGDGGHDLTKLQLVENGRLPSSVQANHQDAHLLLAPEAIEQLGERETHLGGIEECGRGVVSDENGDIEV